MIQRQHNVSEPIPPFYIKTLISLESSLNNAISKEKEAKKKMNATNAKALTAMKQKVKKASKEYETDLAKYQAVRSPAPLLNSHLELHFRIQRHSNASIPHLSPEKHPSRPLPGLLLLSAMVTRPTILPPLERVAKLCSSLPRASTKTSRLYKKLVERRSVKILLESSFSDTSIEH